MCAWSNRNELGDCSTSSYSSHYQLLILEVALRIGYTPRARCLNDLFYRVPQAQGEYITETIVA